MSAINEIRTSHGCEAIQDLIADYAFGLTTLEETRLVEATLPHCPDARSELAQYKQIQAAMLQDVPQIAPPAHLESRLMAAIASTPPLAAPPSPKPTPAVPRPAESRRMRSPAWWLAAAALLALVGSNVFWFLRQDSNEPAEPQILITTTPDTTTAVTLTRPADLRLVSLPASQEDSAATTFLMWNAESETGLLYVKGFAPLPEDRTYQLWLTREGVRFDVGTFRVDENGDGMLMFRSDQSIDVFTWAWITDEPLEGSAEPTGPVIAQGEL